MSSEDAIVGCRAPTDLMARGTSAYLGGSVDAAIRAWQSGYQTSLHEGRELEAARFAFWITVALGLRGEHAVQAGWLGRMQRLLDHEPADCVERGYLLAQEIFGCLGRGDLAGAAVKAAGVVEAGRRHGDQDLVSVGLMHQGRLDIYAGRVPQGLALLDESMVGISTGEVSPIISGMLYCSMIEACQELADFSRVISWTRALTTWCDNQPGLVPFTGQCTLHRGQIMRLHGAYEEALAEFALAEGRYVDSITPAAAAATAMIEQGDVLRIRGDLEAAAEAYGRAAALGSEPQPGLVLLWLERGRTAAATSAAQRLLSETPNPVQRARLLPAAVEILLAGGAIDQARLLSDELSKIAADFDCAALYATAAHASASVALAVGDVDAALGAARDSCRRWVAEGAPYEAARARMVLGQALRALGDEDSAIAELAAAEATFAELGAVPAERQVSQLLSRRLPGGITERELEVLGLVAAGRSNAEIARALVLSQKTVARHLSNIFTKLGVTSRTAAAAYAHTHGLVS